MNCFRIQMGADDELHSRGPGTAFPFAFEIIRLLCGDEKVKEVKDPMVFPSNTYQT